MRRGSSAIDVRIDRLAPSSHRQRQSRPYGARKAKIVEP
jgi:hypothetical protein